MKGAVQSENSTRLPDSFRKLLWSYNLDLVDPELQKRTVIVNTINYGDLGHWRWIFSYYGKEVIESVLSTVKETEMRPSARRLAVILFDLNI